MAQIAACSTFPAALLYTAASQRLRRWGAKSLSHAAILEWPGFALLMMMLFMGAHGATILHPLWIGLSLAGSRGMPVSPVIAGLFLDSNGCE